MQVTENNSMATPNKLDVDEEYCNALRTKSYVDLYTKVHDQQQLERTTSAAKPTTNADELERRNKLQHSNSSPMPFPCYSRVIPEFLLEPSQESLLAAAAGSATSEDGRFHRNLNAILLDFFDATLQACIACSSLLFSIDQARFHHRAIHRLFRLVARSSSSAAPSFSQLSSHLALDNPLSPEMLSHFHLIHSCYPPLVRRLTSAHCKIVRRLKIVRVAKKASGLGLCALFGVVARRAKGKVGRWLRGWGKLESARARTDVAARGAYIVGRDMDTMSRVVTRVHDEVEHGREVARMVVGSKEWEMAREMVREMEGRGGEVGMRLEEQLEELEEHVYLCLTTINRSRRLVAKEMMEPQPEVVVA